MTDTNHPQTTVHIDKSIIPPFLDVEGVKRHLAPLSRSLLYELATQGEIESASLGMRRGRRVFVTESIVRWLHKRMALTRKPNIAPRTKVLPSKNSGLGNG